METQNYNTSPEALAPHNESGSWVSLAFAIAEAFVMVGVMSVAMRIVAPLLTTVIEAVHVS